MQVFLRPDYPKMHIFSKTTNDVGVLKHQQYISNGFTLSLQKELNTFRNELFNAIFAERISSERACHVSQQCREVRADNTILITMLTYRLTFMRIARWHHYNDIANFLSVGS